MSRGAELTGQRFGLLLVTGASDRRTRAGSRYWFCKCDCGAGPVEVSADQLKAGKNRSCGCLRRSRAGQLNVRHRRSATIEYWIWRYAARRAREEHVEFDLQLDDIVIPEVCPVLGIPLRRDAKRPDPDLPSLDRVSAGGGYTKANTRVISWRANYLKKSGTAAEFARILVYMEMCGDHAIP